MAKQQPEVLTADGPATYGTPGTYTILHGDAPPFSPQKSISISGTLGAPLAFLVGRGEIDDTKTHLLIDNDKGRLDLMINDTDPHTSHKITGTLSPDANLAAFQINTEKRWGIREFTKFCKMARYYFADESEANNLINELQKFEGNVNKVYKDHNDNTGDSLIHLETKVTGIKMQRTFRLKVPVYKGYAPQVFTVEIGFDTKSTLVDLFLVSDELYALLPKLREELMSMEIAKFAEYNFARVVVS
jgi:hypothetical protein